jgi:hypothetical protein
MLPEFLVVEKTELRTMLRHVILLVFLFGVFQLDAQTGRQHAPLYDLSNTRYLNYGWQFAPGITYMFPSDFRREETRLSSEGGITDTLYSGTFVQKGHIGAYAEIGRHKFLDYYFLLDNLDYGIGFKMLRGTETFDGVVKPDSVSIPVSNKGYFNESFVSAFINFSNIHQISDNKFIQNSLGFNLDYRVIENRTYSGINTGMIHSFPDDLLFQLHYKLGFGFRPQARIFVIPTIETPILTIYKLDDGKSTLQYFSSRYRPIIFTIRICFLKPRPSQDYAPKSDGSTGHQLWDKKMRRKYRR